jgi:hypothetical protein
MPSDRDPRTDPRPGDVLRTRHDGSDLVVTAAANYWPENAFVTYERGNDKGSCTLIQWQAWSRTAAVLRRGDEEDDHG